MSTMTSKAARDLGKAYHEWQAAKVMNPWPRTGNEKAIVMAAYSDFIDAAEKAAQEIVKDGHHLAEGD